LDTNYESLSLEELEIKANEFRTIRDNATRELRVIVAEIDKRKATESVKDIVSGLSAEQKKEMYAQLIGVGTAISGASAKSGSRK